MGFPEAQRCFEENCRLIGPPQRDFMQWNLNSGLARMAEQLESDLGEIDSLLRKILQVLGHQE